MIVLSNRRLGPGAEVLVSDGVAAAIVRATAAAARAYASARWEHELVRWLDAIADGNIAAMTARRPTRDGNPTLQLDVGDIAWTPDHFEHQRRFLLDAMSRAAAKTADVSDARRVLDLWRRLVEAHPADSVQVGRRWIWQPTA